MDLSLLMAATLAAAAYTLTPGPAFLALLGIGAAQGRMAGAGFLCGHFVGDVVWAFLALVAIVGAKTIGTTVFDLLGLVCGAYLFWIGWTALRARPAADGSIDTAVRRPLLRGLAFGLTNPKGYPVAVAMFTALLAADAGSLSWDSLPWLLAASACGFVAADLLLVLVVGASPVRRLYRRHALLITRASGLLFIGFAVHAVAHSLPGLVARRG